MLQRGLIAGLVLLAGSVLVWVVTAGSDGSSSTQRATSPEERKAVRLERRLAEDPTDEARLAAAAKAWIVAGAERLGQVETRSEPIPEVVVEDYEAGLRAWNRYLQQTGGEASAELAAMVGGTLFQLVEIGSTDPDEATANAARAVRAQKIVCKHDPNLLTLSNLATYEYFNGENTTGDETARRATKHIVKSQRASVFIQLDGSKERGEKFVARVKRGMKTLEETGEEELEKPIKGYGAAAGINGYEPGDSRL